MDISRMHLEFKLEIDKLDSSAYPELEPEEIDYWLNVGQDSFVKTRYGKNNIYRASFEEIQKRTDDLKTLVKTKFISSTNSAIDDNTYVNNTSLLRDSSNGDLSNDVYMFYLRSEAFVVKPNCNGKWLFVKLVQQDDLEKIKRDPFNRPNDQQVIGYFEDNSLNIITQAKSVVSNIKITFLKQPVEMRYGAVYPIPEPNVNCELNEFVHREIIAVAAEKAMENFESKRQQTLAAQNLRTVE